MVNLFNYNGSFSEASKQTLKIIFQGENPLVVRVASQELSQI
jgi:hypothetical protein